MTGLLVLYVMDYTGSRDIMQGGGFLGFLYFFPRPLCFSRVSWVRTIKIRIASR